MSKPSLEQLRAKAASHPPPPPPRQQPAPAPVTQTPGQKAAATKAAAKAAASGQPASQPGQPEPVQGNLKVSQNATGFSISLEPDGNWEPGQEYHFAWSITAVYSGGYWTGQDKMVIDLSSVEVSDLGPAAAALEPVAAALRLAIEGSDDSSIAHVVHVLASHYRVRSVALETPDGNSREIRRGQSYSTLLDMVGKFVTAPAKPTK